MDVRGCGCAFHVQDTHRGKGLAVDVLSLVEGVGGRER